MHISNQELTCPSCYKQLLQECPSIYISGKRVAIEADSLGVFFDSTDIPEMQPNQFNTELTLPCGCGYGLTVKFRYMKGIAHMDMYVLGHQDRRD